MYGVEQRSLKLLEAYLPNGSQTCFINGSFSNSKCKSVRCGISQGSILALLFFLVYINDLPNCFSYCTPRMFPDDTTLTVCGKSDLSPAMNHDLNNVHDCLMANRLCFVPSLLANCRDLCTGDSNLLALDCFGETTVD